MDEISIKLTIVGNGKNVVISLDVTSDELRQLRAIFNNKLNNPISLGLFDGEFSLHFDKGFLQKHDVYIDLKHSLI